MKLSIKEKISILQSRLETLKLIGKESKVNYPNFYRNLNKCEECFEDIVKEIKGVEF